MLYDPPYLIFVTASSDFGVFASSLSNFRTHLKAYNAAR